MRLTSTIVIAALAAAMPAIPAAARHHHDAGYRYNGQNYNSYEQCREARSRHKRDGTIAGAAIAGVGAAVLGANLGTSALIAGGGAVVGHEIGRKKHC